MVTHVHEEYVRNFTDEKYQQFLRTIHPTHDPKYDFRISETPVFLPESFKTEIFALFNDISSFLKQPGFANRMAPGLPEKYRLPNQDQYPSFVAVDFAVCEEDGKIVPRLIEMQGIASLYFYQKNLNNAYQQAFGLPAEYSFFYNGLTEAAYVETMRHIIVGNSDPENVVMMDIKPMTQKTRIDFMHTQKELGIAVKCVSDIKQRGSKLYYTEGGKEIPIERIYNRFIFDELERRPDIVPGFNLKDDLDVVWHAHLNWYFLVSKYCLPFMDSPYVPKATLLSDYHGTYPADLENYVLKPLFSFAGVGVEFDVTPEKLQAVGQTDQYMLQRKVNYTPCVLTKDVPAKAEVRLLCVWDEQGFRPLLSLSRLSKGKILGVDFNKDKTWVGSSAVFFVPGI